MIQIENLDKIEYSDTIKNLDMTEHSNKIEYIDILINLDITEHSDTIENLDITERLDKTRFTSIFIICTEKKNINIITEVF